MTNTFDNYFVKYDWKYLQIQSADFKRSSIKYPNEVTTDYTISTFNAAVFCFVCELNTVEICIRLQICKR